MNKNLFKSSKKIRAWEAFTDLIAFISLFIVVAYAGGYTYTKEYYSQFYIRNKISESIDYYVTEFIVNVVLRDTNSIILYSALLLFTSLIFYLSKYLLPTILGYTLLSLYFVSFIVFGAHQSKKNANNTANLDWLDNEHNNNPKAIVEFNDEYKVSDELKIKMDNNTMRLLMDEGGWIYLYAPLLSDTDQSAKEIYSLEKIHIKNIKYIY